MFPHAISGSNTRTLPVCFLLFWCVLACCQAQVGTTNYDQISHNALALYNQGNVTTATALLEGGLASATREKKPEWQAVMLGLLGPVYESSGKYLEAEDALNRSIYDWTKIAGPNTSTLVGPLANLGELYTKAGQPARAEKLLSRALSIENESGREPELEARLLTNLGNVYLEENKDPLAERAADDALKTIARMKELKPDTTAVYSLLAALSFRAGRFSEAESWLQKSLTARESVLPADDPRIADSVANLAIFYSNSDQLEKARPLFERARGIFESRGGDDRFIRNFYRSYAEFERKSGNKKEAKELSKRVEKLWSTSSASALSGQIVDINSLRAAR